METLVVVTGNSGGLFMPGLVLLDAGTTLGNWVNTFSDWAYYGILLAVIAGILWGAWDMVFGNIRGGIVKVLIAFFIIAIWFGAGTFVTELSSGSGRNSKGGISATRR